MLFSAHQILCLNLLLIYSHKYIYIYYRKYSEGGKISIMLVNTVALVEQHSKYFENHTSFSVATYTGDMNVDNWDKEKWLMEFNKYNVLIMTCQILKNISEANFIGIYFQVNFDAHIGSTSIIFIHWY